VRRCQSIQPALGSGVAEKQENKLILGHIEMASHIVKNGRERSDPERVVGRDGEVMFPVFQGSEAQVATGLAGYVVAERV
jgi:hypothetical protein